MSLRSFRRAQERRVDRARRRAAVLARRGGIAFGVLGSSGVLAASAQAGTFTVTTSNDDAPGGTCSAGSCPTLRDALTAANLDSTADVIQFAPSVTGPITLSHGALPITGSGGLTISGPGASALTISGNNASQVFDIAVPSTASVAINGLTLTKGNGGSANPGGAIQSKVTPSNGAAPLTLSGDAITNSTTSNSKGGGAIFAEDAPLTVTASTLSGNTAPGARGGAIAATSKYELTTITDSTITGNVASSGGGIDIADGKVVDSQITSNTANGSGSDGNGGGIASEDGLVLTGSVLSGNTATGDGGGVAATSKYDTAITGSTITGNKGGIGGGMWLKEEGDSGAQTDVETTTISANQATDNGGGGVAVHEVVGGEVRIGTSTITGNAAGASADGGGVLVEGDVYSSFLLSDSTVTGNTAGFGGGVGLGPTGSSPATEQLIGTDESTGRRGSITIGNDTIDGNAATAAAGGGGIFLSDYSTGSPAVIESGTAAIESTIVAGNTAAGAGSDLARIAGTTNGGFTSAFSLIQTPGTAPLTATSTIEGVSPALGALASNGGPTQTMMPSSTSPVIDQGHSSSSLTADQRGAARDLDTAVPNPPGGDGTDIGAVELPASGVFVAPIAPPTPTPALSVSVRGIALGGSASPLIVGNSTPVLCKVTVGTLASCVIEIRSGSKLVASGEAVARGGATQLSTTVTPTAVGLTMLKRKPLGLSGTVEAVASATGSPSLTGSVNLLAKSSITLPLAKRNRALSKGLVSQLKQVAGLLAGAKNATCTAYSDKGTGDKSLTLAQAKAACATLKKDGFTGKTRAVGAGHASPAAKNAGHQAANRRLVITFSF